MQPAAQTKELGFWMCTALVVGNTIGIGIYVLPASLAPYGFNAMLGWGITVVGMTVLARVFARLAREFPSADGPHAYIERTTGTLAAFVAIWCYWVSCWITNAAIAIGVVGYLNKVLPGLGEPVALRIEPADHAVGRSLAELDLRSRTGAIVLAINRGGEHILLPTGHEKVNAGDVLAIAGTPASVRDSTTLLREGDGNG